MKPTSIILTLGLLAAIAIPARAQRYEGTVDELTFAQRNLGGPRLGATYVMGQNTLTKQLKQNNIGSFISQFGWHFEYQIIPRGYGPSFVIQFVPLVGGVEYGQLIPSATLAMGIRFPNGIEFGMGPNAIVTQTGVKSALVIAVGKSINYGGVSIPLNLAFATNPDGNRISFIFGYSIYQPPSK
jgi:hypothetical protein